MGGQGEGRERGCGGGRGERAGVEGGGEREGVGVGEWPLKKKQRCKFIFLNMKFWIVY